MKTIYIYTLAHPTTGEIRYVGKTTCLKKRHNQHCYPDNNHYVSRWTKKLMREGLKPVMEIIDEASDKDWEFWEQWYICLFRSWGFRLTNTTDGGEGNHGRPAWNKGKKGYKHPKPRANYKGGKNPSAKLSDAKVLEIRSKLSQGVKQVDICKEYNSSKQSINKIATGRTYKHLPLSIIT